MIQWSKNDIHNMILFRDKFNQSRKHVIYERDPSSVYDNHCEVCKILNVTDCTEHRTHTQTDFETAPEKKLQNREIIQQIQNEALPNCFAFRTNIEMNFKTVFSDLDNLNSEMLTNIEKLTGCLHKVLHNFRLEHRCLKQKIEMKKCIASTYIYEHVYEHSSDAPIKFLLSVKKHRSNNKTFKNHGQITLTKLLNPKTVIEKLLTIKLRDKGKQLSINSISDQIAKMLRAPKAMLSFFKNLPMLLSDVPMIESEPDFGQC